MANSKYEYVKSYEQNVQLLPNTFLVVRLDGRNFHHLAVKYGFAKPNDHRALDLMNAAAIAVLKEIPDISLAYGISDEFSFIYDRSSNLFDRRESNGHINNLYNTTFWALVQKGDMGTTQAEETLKGTLAADKNEILFSKFGINYNKEPEQFKKGSVVYKDYGIITSRMCDKSTTTAQGNQGSQPSKTQKDKEKKTRQKAEIRLEYVDIIHDDFWEARPWLFPDT